MVNPVAAGFVAGGILARSSGPSGVLGGGLAFAAFSGAIDLFMRREPAEYVLGPLHRGISLTSYASDD
jgi:import inner membrane translocase subunit TIM22